MRKLFGDVDVKAKSRVVQIGTQLASGQRCRMRVKSKKESGMSESICTRPDAEARLTSH